MSKRKRKMPRPAKFKRGDKVRVKHGVRDADYPDMPLGGWAGTIAETHDDGTCTVQWSKQTLASIHPVFKKRCERDGFDFDLYCLGEDDLESDIGCPIEIEQPIGIVSKPLSVKNQDDRMRMIFGLTSDDPVPDVDDETMMVYYKHLSKNLVFPFTAVHGEEYGHSERVKVIGLGDPEDEPMIDETHGILCESRMESQIITLPLGELEDVQAKSNRQLVDDYCYWFHHWT